MDLLWPFRRKVSILIPNTPEFYDLYENGQIYHVRGNQHNWEFIITNPTIHLRREIIQILEIFGVPYRLKGIKPAGHSIGTFYFTQKYEGLYPTDKEARKFLKKTRELMIPYLIVRAKDFIEVNDAIQKYIGEVQSAAENKAP